MHPRFCWRRGKQPWLPEDRTTAIPTLPVFCPAAPLPEAAAHTRLDPARHALSLQGRIHRDHTRLDLDLVLARIRAVAARTLPEAGAGAEATVAAQAAVAVRAHDAGAEEAGRALRRCPVIHPGHDPDRDPIRGPSLREGAPFHGHGRVHIRDRALCLDLPVQDAVAAVDPFPGQDRPILAQSRTRGHAHLLRELLDVAIVLHLIRDRHRRCRKSRNPPHSDTEHICTASNQHTRFPIWSTCATRYRRARLMLLQ